MILVFPKLVTHNNDGVLNRHMITLDCYFYFIDSKSTIGKVDLQNLNSQYKEPEEMPLDNFV